MAKVKHRACPKNKHKFEYFMTSDDKDFVLAGLNIGITREIFSICSNCGEHFYLRITRYHMSEFKSSKYYMDRRYGKKSKHGKTTHMGRFEPAGRHRSH
jgi:hypothetical protein